MYDAEYLRVRAFAGTSGSGTCSLVELTVGMDSSLALRTTFQDRILPHTILTQRATHGLPTLTDKGYTGAGAGIHVPTKGNNLAPDNHTRNRTINALRAPAERANALLKRTWKALERVTLDPWRIGQITTAALVLLKLQRPAR